MARVTRLYGGVLAALAMSGFVAAALTTAGASAASTRVPIPDTHPSWANATPPVAITPITTGTVSVRVYLEGRDPARTVVLLAHQPKAIDEAERFGVDLQLSGHTHGGQIFPFNFLVRLQQPYVAGLHAHGRAMIYVSRGTGYWGPPNRFGVPSEITRIRLVPAGLPSLMRP